MEIDWGGHPCDESHFYNYVDFLADTLEAIYVGKGSKSRILVESRNQKHENYVQKHGLRRVIVACFDDDESARSNEILLIQKFKTFYLDNTKGCNFTLGGEGTSGLIPWNKGLMRDDIFTEDSLKKMKERVSKSLTGRKLTEINKIKIGLSNSGKVRSEETKRKISESVKISMMNSEIREKCKSHLGKNLSGTHKEKLSNSLKGRKVTEEHRNNIRKSKQVAVLQFINDQIVRYESINEASKKTGVHRGSITACCKGIYKTAGGYKWEYENT